MRMRVEDVFKHDQTTQRKVQTRVSKRRALSFSHRPQQRKEKRREEKRESEKRKTKMKATHKRVCQPGKNERKV
jgi:hypothetical protein